MLKYALAQVDSLKCQHMCVVCVQAAAAGGRVPAADEVLSSLDKLALGLQHDSRGLALQQAEGRCFPHNPRPKG